MLLATGLVAYYAIHSLMASESVKKSISRWVNDLNYRLMYSVVSFILLIPVVIVYIRMTPYIFAETGLWGRFVLLTSVLLALKIFILSFKKIQLMEFLGLKPIRKNQLITTGIYQYIRHPLYLSISLVLTGLSIATPSDRNFIVFAITVVYIIIGSHLEEKRLIREYGDLYQSYKSKTPMLIPCNFKAFFKYVMG